jgi:hypothetical protein
MNTKLVQVMKFVKKCFSFTQGGACNGILAKYIADIHEW